ncbi:MAG: hypothetical protein FD155_1048 [Bacteroidetes bacterium]|nr:MAG: hypothetical protein FD155_1048 [Bacteroidota bacterium]
MRKIILLLFFCLAFISNSFGQYYLSGQDPSNIRWKQLQSANFRIIFPKTQEHEAQRIANLLEMSYPHLRNDFSTSIQKTNLILHTHSVISNASAAWAPRRLDFYHTPPQDSYSQEWYKQLSLHELRHIIQFSSLDKGFGKVISALTGQQGTAGVMGVFVPLWFIEGDAVVTETVFSSSGRGRQSLFEAGLKAQVVERGPFSYDKAYFGSFKDHVPDVYELGYVMVGYNQMKHGNEVWSSALDRVGRRPWQLNPFSGAIKHTTGMNKKQLYKSTMNAMAELWKQEDSLFISDSMSQGTADKQVFTNYRSPHFLSDGGVIAIRQKLDDVSAIVAIRDGQEEVLFRQGPMLHNWLSVSDRYVVWSEFQPDLRWSNRNFSVIKTGDIQTGKIKQLTKKSRLFAPDILSDNSKIVAVESDENEGSALVVLKVETGEELFRLQNDSLFFMTPRWIPGTNEFVCVALGNEGKCIMRFNPNDSRLLQLTPFTYTDFSLSDATSEGVFLQGDWKGNSAVYFFRFDDQSLRLIQSSRFGGTEPQLSPSGDSLIFADYSSSGFKLRAIATRDFKGETMDFKQQPNYLIADKLAQNTTLNLDKSKETTSVFPVSKYRKAAHLFQFHSWSPIYIEADNQQFEPGISLFSQNALSTMVTEVGFKYDRNEQTGRVLGNVSYLGFYPELSLGFGYGLRRSKAMYEEKEYDLKWYEADWSISATIPFNLSRDRWLRGFYPTLSFRQIHRKMEPGMPLNFQEATTASISYGFYIYNQSRLAHRDIYPKWGQTFQVLYRHAPFDKQPASQFYAGMNLFLPGLMKQHGIKLFGAFQQEQSGFFNFSNLAAYPRGYTSLSFSEVFAFKSDYVLPVWYPEWNWPAVCYLKRIRGGVFFDYLQGNYSGSTSNLLSAGIELHSDWHFFNIPAPFDIGFRLIYRDAYGDWVPEALFGINFSALY